MGVEPTVATRRVALGQIRVYLGQCQVEDVRRYRQLFGAVTLQGLSGLAVIKRLHMLGDLDGIDLDPATYRKLPDRQGSQLQLDVGASAFDWVRAQRALGLPTIRTAGRLLRAGDRTGLRMELATDLGDVSVVLALDGRWLASPHVEVLLEEIVSADRDVTLVLAAVFDPLNSARRIEGLREVLRLGNGAGRRVELIRTDPAGLIAVTEGAAATAIGLMTSTRHHGLPMSRRQIEEHEQRNQSPLVYVPNLLHWQRGARLGGLAPWRGAGVTGCPCGACTDAGRDLLRFSRSFETIPTEVQEDVRRHDALALSQLAQSVRASHDPAGYLRGLRQGARHLLQNVEDAHKVRLQDPPAWLQWP